MYVQVVSGKLSLHEVTCERQHHPVYSLSESMMLGVLGIKKERKPPSVFADKVFFGAFSSSVTTDLVPGLLEVAESKGTPATATWRPSAPSSATGSRMKDAMPAARARSFPLGGSLYEATPRREEEDVTDDRRRRNERAAFPVRPTIILATLTRELHTLVAFLTDE